MQLAKTLLLILFPYIFFKETYAQKIDYLEIRDSLTSLTCGNKDGELVKNTILKLEAVDTNVLGKNIHEYYYDLGMAYFNNYLFTNDTDFLTKNIRTFEKALYHKPKFYAALWNISLSYYLLGNCPKSVYFLRRHKKATPKRKWMKDQFQLIEKKCLK